MSNIFKIKHGSDSVNNTITPAETTDLEEYELGFGTNTNTLYINNGTEVVVPFASVKANNIDGVLDASQIPNLAASKITSGTLPVARGGTGLTSLDTFVRTTGNQTIEGLKTFLNSVYVGGYLNSTNDQEYSALYFRSPSFGRVNTIQTVVSNNAGNRTGNRFQFLQYSYTENTATTLDNYDAYVLPTVAAGKTGNNTYEILTSKNVVTVAQGGTGLTSLDTFVRTTGAQTISDTKTFTSYLMIDRSSTALALNGVLTMLAFKYKNPNNNVKTVNVIRTMGDNETGANNGIAIVGSSSGTTIISSGEAAPAVVAGENITNSEATYIIADSTINFWSNANTYESDSTALKKAVTIDATGRTKFLSYGATGFYARNISYGTSDPLGGANGDIYIKHVN